MHGVGLDNKLDFWFDIKVPRTSHAKKSNEENLITLVRIEIPAQRYVLWLGGIRSLFKVKIILNLRN